MTTATGEITEITRSKDIVTLTIKVDTRTNAGYGITKYHLGKVVMSQE